MVNKTYDVSQTSFSGGIIEAKSPSSFTERSLSRARGWMFESEDVLRTQPSCQKVGNVRDFFAIKSYQGSSGNYLVGLHHDGSIRWCKAPPSTALNTTTRAVTWNTFPGANGNGLNFIVDNDNVVLPSGRVNALVVNNDSIAYPGYKIYENENSATLNIKEYSDRIPEETTVDNAVTPVKGKLPPGNVGAVLGSRLFLGDTYYSRSDEAFSLFNNKKYSSGIWFSELDTTSFFTQAFLYAASTEAQIRGMHVLDNKLIIITTAGPDGDGVLSISGDFSGPAEAVSMQEVTSRIDSKILRGGTGAPRKTVPMHKNYSCVWSEAGIVCFIDRLGGVWSTDGFTVSRLDVVGPKGPALASEDDHVEAVGRNLFVARDNRLLVLSMLGTEDAESSSTTGAWTELVTPDASRAPSKLVLSMTALEDCLYFLTASGDVYRFNMNPAVDIERGRIDDTLIDLHLGTRTFGDPDQHDRKAWLRFGVRASTRTTGTFKSVTVKPGPVLDAGTSGYTVVPSSPNVSSRYQAVLNAGIGSHLEASAELVFTGDVVIEEISWIVNGVVPKR